MKTGTRSTSSSGIAQEQRKEPRYAAKGKVTVTSSRGTIAGQLVDVSQSGFRMAHSDATLEPGQVLGFLHTEAAGKARVIWNRILEQRVETGFLIVERV
jgi:hypothetical protein